MGGSTGTPNPRSWAMSIRCVEDVTIAVTDVTIERAPAHIFVGENVFLIARVEPFNATNQAVTWTNSNPEVATIDAPNLRCWTTNVVGVSPGTTTITATTDCGTHVATGTVSVGAPATGITLNKPGIALTVGETETLIATVHPAGANQNVEWWSNNTLVATVDDNGVVTAHRTGTATITASARATHGAHTATAIVQVTPQVTGVTLNNTSISLSVGGTETLIPSIQPANAVNQNVTWQSNNNAIASVDDNGVVTGVSPGMATITVTTEDGARTATAAVMVTTPSPTGVRLDRNSIQVFIDRTETLAATVLPAYALNREVTWSSNNPSVAIVDENGVVTGVSTGTATITVTTVDGGHTASTSVSVSPWVSVTGVIFGRRPGWLAPISPTPISVGVTSQFFAALEPAGASNQNVTWSSSNPAVATVDAHGIVRAVSTGIATITITTEDGGYTVSTIVHIVTPTFDHGVVIDGIRWATRNVGTPGTFGGGAYQWNRNIMDRTENWNGNGASVWQRENDPCPPGWRVPTRAEFESLNNADQIYLRYSFGQGIAFGNPLNQIYLAGPRVGVGGVYWSSTSSGANEAYAFISGFNGFTGFSSESRANSHEIRCVAIE